MMATIVSYSNLDRCVPNELTWPSALTKFTINLNLELLTSRDLLKTPKYIRQSLSNIAMMSYFLRHFFLLFTFTLLVYKNCFVGGPYLCCVLCVVCQIEQTRTIPSSFKALKTMLYSTLLFRLRRVYKLVDSKLHSFIMSIIIVLIQNSDQNKSAAIVLSASFCPSLHFL